MKFKALLAAAAFVATTMVAAGAMADEKKEITIATEGAFPPYNLTRADGTLDGYDVELAHYLCDHMKIKCTIIAQAFDGMIPALNAGKFDAIMAGMSATEKRRQVIDFSIPYGNTGQAFATLKDGDLTKLPLKGQIFSLDTNMDGVNKAIAEMKPLLKGKVIGVQTASTAARFVDTYFKDVAQIREYKTTEQHDLDLKSGRVDLIMASMGYISTAVKKPGNSDIVVAGPRFTNGFLGAGSSVGLRKDETALKAKFDDAIKAAEQDGTLKKLSEKWFGFDVTPQ